MEFTPGQGENGNQEGNALISEIDAEKAIDWLRDNAKGAAQAKAERIYVEEYKKSLEAQLMSDPAECQATSARDREALARAHPKYIAHLQAIKAAVENDEAMRWLMVAAQAKIEAWRTQQANARAEGRAYS